MVERTATLGELIDHLVEMRRTIMPNTPVVFTWEGISTPVVLKEIYLGEDHGGPAVIMDADQDMDKGSYRGDFGGC